MSWHPSLGAYTLPITRALPPTQSLFDLGFKYAYRRSNSMPWQSRSLC